MGNGRKALREVQKMSSYEDYRDFILEKLDERVLLEQLAEEASEVAQAALKLIRAKELSNNNTPVREQEGMLSLALEYMDLLMVYDMLLEKDRKILRITKANSILPEKDMENYFKWNRWAERLGYKD